MVVESGSEIASVLSRKKAVGTSVQILKFLNAQPKTARSKLNGASGLHFPHALNRIELFYTIFKNAYLFLRCAGGFKTRSRECINGQIGSEDCPLKDYLDIQTCDYVSDFRKYHKMTFNDPIKLNYIHF